MLYFARPVDSEESVDPEETALKSLSWYGLMYKCYTELGAAVHLTTGKELEFIGAVPECLEEYVERCPREGLHNYIRRVGFHPDEAAKFAEGLSGFKPLYKGE